LLLLPGSYVIGRSSTCHIVIAQPLVSRRHAQLSVTARSAIVTDLGSINGVFLNGRRIDAPAPLSSGDTLSIGGEELAIRLQQSVSSVRPQRTVDTLSGADPVVPSGDSDPPPPSNDFASYDSEPPTAAGPSGGLRVIGAVAERAIAAGRPREAEEMMRYHLTAALDDVRAGRRVAADTVDVALEYGVKLALATGSGQWFDYAVDLLLIGRGSLSEAAGVQLAAAAQRVSAIDVTKLLRYRDAVRGMHPSFDKVRAARVLEQLLRIAATKAR
jgi:hypothetical protein